MIKSYSEAIKYFQISADNGDKFSQYNLALIYEKGTGTAKDWGKAWKLYQQSADNNFPQALSRVKSMCELKKALWKEKIDSFNPECKKYLK